MMIDMMKLEKIHHAGDTQKKKARQEAAKYRTKVLVQGCECEVCEFWIYSVLRLHHVYPVGTGWDSHPENMVFLCPNCHAIVHELAKIANVPTAKRSNDKTIDLFFGLLNSLKDIYTENQIEKLLSYSSHIKRP